MRPILVNIPAKLLFVVALALALGSFVRDVIRRRRDKTVPWSSTPLYGLIGAELLIGFKSGSWVPSAAGFAQPWTPVPIYAYGVMLGTSLVVGWFIAMTLAKKDGIDQQEAGTIYMWTAVWSIVGSRLLYVITNISEFDSITQVVMVNRGGLVAYGGMIGGFLASVYCCRKRGIPLLRWADVAAPSVVLGTAITRVGCAVGHPIPAGQPGLEPSRTRLRPGSRRALVVPGSPDTDLRIAGRPVPVRDADADS